MTQSKDRSASTGSGFGGAARRVLRTGALLLVFLLVASIGLVIGEVSPDAEPTPTELALTDGATAAQALAVAAASLEETAPAGSSARYTAVADMLHLHALALHPVAGSATASPSPVFSSAESESPSAPSSPPAAPSPREFLGELTDSYTRAFEAAATVDAGPARVLASAATAQWLQSRALAETARATAPPLPLPELRHDDGSAPACPTDSTPEPEPGLDGARTAVLAEQRASWAYEVVAARAAEPEQLLQRMAHHEAAAALGSAILAQHCVAEPLPAAAYALTATFLSDPDTALRGLEEELVRTYTDLVGISAPGPVRDWAIRQLAETAQYVADSTGGDSGGTDVEAFPGIDPSEYPRLPAAGG